METQSRTPRKGKRQRNLNHQQQHQQHPNQAQIQPVTDYETDFPDMQPPPLTRTNEELNHAVLRRYYPHIKEIISTASYAVLYQFSPESSSWVKLEIEGTLFISELQPSEIGASRYHVVILNRRGFDNFEQELNSSEDVEVTSEYVILKGGREGEEVVYGLWIFAEAGTSTANARLDNAKLIVDCALLAEESGKRALERAMKAETQGAQQVTEASNGYSAEQDEDEDEVAGGVPMGRQLSLRELFGQQREHDAGFAVHHHESTQVQNLTTAISQAPQQQILEQETQTAEDTSKAQAPAFFSNPDTDFFRSGPRFTPKQDELAASRAPPAIAPDANSNHLLMLLRGKG